MLSKSVSFRKLVIPFLLAKFACANLAAKFFDVNLLNSSVVYLVWSVVTFISISLNSVLQSVFFTYITSASATNVINVFN